MTNPVMWHYRVLAPGEPARELDPTEGRTSVSVEEARKVRDALNANAVEWGGKPRYYLQRRRNTWIPVT